MNRKSAAIIGTALLNLIAVPEVSLYSDSV
jgi:hypothetical protein